MRTAIVFVTGLAIGAVMSPLLAQGDRVPVNNMNHIAIAYENFDEAFDFYTKKMGFKEGFTVRNAQGQPTLSYVQASRDTFIEIQPANANRKAGLNHYGLHVADLKAYVAALKQRGVLVKNVASTHPLLAGCLRVTVGTVGENETFMKALRASLGNER